jgi:hypothetical protein
MKDVRDSLSLFTPEEKGITLVDEDKGTRIARLKKAMARKRQQRQQREQREQEDKEGEGQS